MAPIDRWTIAWLAASLAVAVHIVDEVAHGAYGLYVDVAWLLRLVAPVVEMPPFREEVWLINLAGSVIVLLALTWLVWMRRGPMVVASYVFAAFLTANAVFHLFAAAMLKSIPPGTWTAPLLLAAGLFLFVSVAWRGG